MAKGPLLVSIFIQDEILSPASMKKSIYCVPRDRKKYKMVLNTNEKLRRKATRFTLNDP